MNQSLENHQGSALKVAWLQIASEHTKIGSGNLNMTLTYSMWQATILEMSTRQIDLASPS